MRLVPHVLLRAPLLPASALSDAGVTSALLEPAIALASPSLHVHADDRAAERLARYRRRAAFRPTPHGLLAGVAMVPIVDEPSRVALGEPHGRLDVTWARLASLGRELLQAEGWARAKLRIAPSLLAIGAEASVLAFGEHEAARRTLALDELLTRVIDATQEWTPASRLARRLGLPREEAKALLLQLVDDGLLHHDLEPPLVGPTPLSWMEDRVPGLHAITRLLEESITSPQLDEVKRKLQALPGVGPSPLHATLLHEAQKSRIERAPLERAAALAPVLFALADALSPPVDESHVTDLDEGLAAASALVGEGLVPIAALDHAAYGTRRVEPRVPSLDVATWLAGLVAETARAGSVTLLLDAHALEVRCGLLRADTFELQLQPCRDDAWLLGVHAPAGSSWGRFAHALGEPMREALEALREAERAIDGDAIRLDVAYAPTRELADLCCVPALREAALAISSWPDEGAVVPSQCTVVNESVGRAHRAIAIDGQRVRVAPLHRVRSTTAPRSAIRALLGDSLRRQHAPWALTWGPLARLPWLPRVELDGFVIAPQSWALPRDRNDAAISAWRDSAKVPRHVQVGTEDVLLPLDLDRAEDRAQLAELTRVYEIWPPLGRELDASGRRIELVCAVVDEDAAPEPVPSLGMALPPRLEPSATGWRTVVLFAARAHHAELIATVAAFAKKSAKSWFVLPYVDDEGEQLRVRLRGRSDAHAAGLAGALVLLVRDLPVVTTQIRPYQPERGRYGAALEAVERLFEADSLLLASEPERTLPDEAHVASLFEALARGLGLSTQELARHEAAADETLAPAYRAVQRPLAALFDAPPPWLRAHTKRVRAARLKKSEAARLFSTLLHLTAVRHLGPDREAELRARYLWTRARKSRAARS